MKNVKRILAVLLAVLICSLCLVPAFAEDEFDPETHEHVWSWAVSQPATCGDPGTQYQFCRVCYEHGYTVTQNENTTIAPTGNHELVWIQDVAPKCGVAGVQHQYCNICKHVYNENTPVEPTGEHSWKWEVVQPETCCKDGFKRQYCTVCRENGIETYQNENTRIPYNYVHTWAWEITTPPTCGQQGVKREYCTVCRESGIETYRNENTLVAATGEHNWAAYPDTDSRNRASTCVREGTKVFYCTVCGNEKSEALPLAAHVDADGDGKCDVCNQYTTPRTGVSLKSIYDRFIDFFWRGIHLIRRCGKKKHFYIFRVEKLICQHPGF